VGKVVRQLSIPARVVVDDAEAAFKLAIAGGGLVRLSELLAGPAVKSGQLVLVSIEHHSVDNVPMSVVCPRGRQRMAKIRVLVDFLVERLSRAPWRLGRATHSARVQRGILSLLRLSSIF
jgi:DNA-binding transcriptional LysR family regulator